MDYGGHDSIFEDNLVMASGRKACIGFGSFKPGHGDIVRNNRCVVGLETIGNSQDYDEASASSLADFKGQIVTKELDNVAMLEQCKDGNAVIYNNSYYTPNGNASYTCWNLGLEVSLADMQEKYMIDQGSTSETLPSVDLMVQWAEGLLMEGSLSKV